MPELKDLETSLATKINASRALHATLEAKGAEATQDERNQLEAMIAEGVLLRKQVDQLRELKGLEDYVSLGGSAAPLSQTAQQLRSGTHEPRKSWGQLVVEHKAFTHNDGMRMSPVDVKAHMRPETPMRDVKAIYSLTDATGGAFTVPQYFLDPAIDVARQRPRSVLDMINVVPTMADAIQYVRMTARTNAAAVVPEYTGGNFGLKPESNLTFDTPTAAVKTIATWVGASRQILQDAPRLRGTIDSELQYMVQVTLEDQIIAGDGTGNNFTGILNTSGIQLRVMHGSAPVGRGQLTTDTKADTIRRAITDIRLAFYQPDAMVLNPADAEAIELTKATTNEYVNGGQMATFYDPVGQRIWRVPVVETPAIPALTALVGNFRLGATLWDRMQTEIRVGEPNDYFLRNALAILAELRAAFGVQRPLAFEKVTLL